MIKFQPFNQNLAKNIISNYYNLKKNTEKSWAFEENLIETCKFYLVYVEKCVVCKAKTHEFLFECGCKYCIDCIRKVSVIDTCEKCYKKLDDKDKNFILSKKY